MAHRFRTLETEMLADPLVRGYGGMTDIGVADDINTNSRTAPDKNSISVAEMWDATIQSEYEAITPAQKVSYGQMLTVASGGALDVTPGSKARTDLEGMFAATGTLTALQALYSGQTFFRWQEIGLSSPVAEGHVADVRRSNP